MDTVFPPYRYGLTCHFADQAFRNKHLTDVDSTTESTRLYEPSPLKVSFSRMAWGALRTST